MQFLEYELKPPFARRRRADLAAANSVTLVETVRCCPHHVGT